MSDILMKGTEPIGQVSDLTADNVEYSSGVSVKDMLTGETLNATSTVGTLGGTFRRIGNLGIFCGAITFTTAITGNTPLIIDLGVAIKGSANWSGVKQSGNTLTPARGYISGRYVYSQVTASANEAIIFTAVFEIA